MKVTMRRDSVVLSIRRMLSNYVCNSIHGGKFPQRREPKKKKKPPKPKILSLAMVPTPPVSNHNHNHNLIHIQPQPIAHITQRNKNKTKKTKTKISAQPAPAPASRPWSQLPTRATVTRCLTIWNPDTGLGPWLCLF